MAQSGPEPKKANFFSNLVGTSIAALSKLTLFQPIDTVATNAMLGKKNFNQFSEKLKTAKPTSKIRMLYQGAGIELLKKWPSNAYRYPVQSATQEYLDNEHGEQFIKMFGDNHHVASSALSGGTTAVVEPFLFQPLDTAQIYQQAHQKSLFETLHGLKFTQLYRGVWVTSLLRNLPSGLMLFGGSSALNKAMDNEDKHNHLVDLGAKSIAGLSSVACSQPGDVLKVQMQANQWSFTEAVKNVPVKQFFTNGSLYRFVGGGLKMGFGFFLAEKAMKVSANILGTDDSNDYSAKPKQP